jgi:hypothetical protein
MTRTAKCLWAIATTIAVGVTSCGAPPRDGKPQGAVTEPLTDDCTHATDRLKYNGGPLLTNVGVRVVFWGNTVDPTVTRAIPGFYRDLVQSPYVDWLSGEYSVTGQTIGRGTLEGVYPILPTNSSSRLTEDDIEAELRHQVDAGALGPAPSRNTLFMVHLSAGVAVSTEEGDTCTLGLGSACGYHKSFDEIRYAVIGDLSFGCDCANGFPGQVLPAFDEVTSTASHELLEAITDPDQNAWMGASNSSCELSDLCTDDPNVRLHFPGSPDRSYIVQQQWSNQLGCIVQKTPTTSDLLWRYSGQLSHGSLAIWPNANPASWNPAIVSDDGWQIAGLGDYDGDARSDILLRAVGSANHGLLQIWHDGNPSSSVSPGRELDDLWQISGTGDFDGDALSDILWRYLGGGLNTGLVVVWRNGDANAASSLGALDLTWQIVGNGDFDLDLRSDILWYQPTTGQFVIWFRGIPAILPITQAGPGTSFTIQSVGDFDGDGRSDIMWRSTPQILIWFDPASPAHFRTTTPIPVDPALQIRSVGDYDGDGNSDILWRYTGPTTTQISHGQLQIWFSGTTDRISIPGIMADDGWQIQGSGAFDPFVQQACIGRCGLVTVESGVQVDCGGCTAPQTCGGGGVANVCGCTRVPNPCRSNQCSVTFPDGCGGVYLCHADCSANGLCPCRGGQCTAGVCNCYKGTCN